jgi:hypothetical protein
MSTSDAFSRAKHALGLDPGVDNSSPREKALKRNSETRDIFGQGRSGDAS